MIIPQQCLDPAVTKFLGRSTLPAPNRPGLRNNYSGVTGTPDRLGPRRGPLDYILNPNMNLWGALFAVAGRTPLPSGLLPGTSLVHLGED